MSVEEQKLEIIEWILKLKDSAAIKAIMKIKKGSFKGTNVRTGAGKFKSGNQLLTKSSEEPGQVIFDPANLLDDITQKYSAVKEEDLDITGIYERREHQHGRRIVFD